MKVTARPEIAEQILKEAAEKNSKHKAPRATGIHLSDLLVCLRRSFFDKTIGKPGMMEGILNMKTMLGEAFHAWLEIEPEKPFEWKGRWHSVDRYEYTEDGRILLPIEIKSTRYSAARGLVDYHVDQLAGYCLATGVSKGRMYVLFLFGDYRENRDPIFVVADVEFTDDELVKWDRILAYRQDLLQKALDTNEPPPIEQRQPWACKDCAFRGGVCSGAKPRTAQWHTNFVDPEKEF